MEPAIKSLIGAAPKYQLIVADPVVAVSASPFGTALTATTGSTCYHAKGTWEHTAEASSVAHLQRSEHKVQHLSEDLL